MSVRVSPNPAAARRSLSPPGSTGVKVSSACAARIDSRSRASCPTKMPPGRRNAMQLGEQSILSFGRRHVMQDREACCRREVVVRQSRFGCVGDDDLDVGPGQPVPQRFARQRIDLHGGEPPHTPTKAGRWSDQAPADLEDLVAQIAGSLDPG